MDEFNARHDWLGFVRAPRWYPDFTGPDGSARVLTTEWIDGSQISELETAEERLKMAQMAVEACVAQLTYTGFVHADPHEGNLLLDKKNGGLVFLDFGLVSTVEDYVMEGFAKGIQCMIAGDWLGLIYVFRDVGFCPTEGFFRKEALPGEKKKRTVPCSAEEMAGAIEAALTAEEGGRSRFGALATGLGSMSGRYKFLTPPYIVLLVRTFLTLEGIAAKADPDFNIYTASLPYAIRRAMAPATPEGQKAMRDAFLNPADNTIRWDKIEELFASAGEGEGEAEAEASDGADDRVVAAAAAEEEKEEEEEEEDASSSATKTELPPPQTESGVGSSRDGSLDDDELELLSPMAVAGESLLNDVLDEAAAAAAATATTTSDENASPASVTEDGSNKEENKEPFGMNPKDLVKKRSKEVLGRLVGAREGAALRRVTFDADSVSLASYLASSSAAGMREKGVQTMKRVLKDLWSVRRAELTKRGVIEGGAATAEGGEDASRKSWPESERARKIRERESKSQRKAISVIVFGHLKRLWMDGQIILIASLALTAARMAFLAVCLATFDKAKECAAAAFGFFLTFATAPFRFARGLLTSTSTARTGDGGNGEIESVTTTARDDIDTA